ncbi:TIGR04255 family protein [Nonomuraea sp. NN258]|uniref:TIGR04255 family protein n=1 Tax=Nonomuraea antri TaxID=2730852 RepID=UPI0015694884|nr:TIGR04255 family protein [Nonomuraea antri]NRQ36621.1 TIGR04255 family protein [Nonomuraea antri]
MYERREIYPNPPLQLVVAEVRYPASPRLRHEDTLDRLRLALEDILPIQRREQTVELEITDEGSQTSRTLELFRLTNRESTISAAITQGATIFESTFYTEFSEFRRLIRRVLEVLADQSLIPAIERLGLRYIDEIRVPGKIRDAADWSEWVSPELVAMAGPWRDNAARSFQSVVTYSIGPDMGMNFRCIAAEGPGVFVKGTVLKPRRQKASGPYFVLDIDSYWEASETSEARKFDVEGTVELFDRLHAPTGKRFQDALNDRSRAVFRGDI